MAPSFPGLLGRPGFRGGGFPHAARRMLSYQEQGTQNEEIITNVKLIKEVPRSLKFPNSPKFNNRRSTKSFNTGTDRRIPLNNIDYNNIANDTSFDSTLNNKKYAIQADQKRRWIQRSLLWSPPQIISSVLKVFRKVLLNIIIFSL